MILLRTEPQTCENIENQLIEHESIMYKELKKKNEAITFLPYLCEKLF